MFNKHLNKITNSDCREVLKAFPDNYFDCCISDVPYKTNSAQAGIADTKSNRYKKRFLVIDGKSALQKNGGLFEHCDIKFGEWLPEVYRVLKNGSHCYLMINGRNKKDLQIEAEKVGFKWLNEITWDKGNKTPNKYYMQQAEYVLLFRKGFAKNVNNMGIGNILRVPNIIGNKVHPTEKPVELMKIFVEQSTNPGDIVLEPFAGAGSTVLACLELERNFVAAEIDPRFYEIAQKRLQEYSFQRSLGLV